MLAFALSLVVIAAPAGPSVRQLVDEAQKAYAKGNFSEAARLLETASKQDPSGRLLFNLARALEKAGEVEKAIVIYEAYLDRPDAELQALKRARQALAVLYRKRPAPPEPTPKEEPPPPTEVKPPPVEPVKDAAHDPITVKELPPPAKAIEPVTPAPPRSSHTMRTVGIVGLATSAVATGVGIGLGLWTQSTARLARSSVDPTEKPLMVAAALQRATSTDVAFIVAAGLAVVSAVFILVDLLSQ